MFRELQKWCENICKIYLVNLDVLVYYVLSDNISYNVITEG